MHFMKRCFLDKPAIVSYNLWQFYTTCIASCCITVVFFNAFFFIAIYSPSFVFWQCRPHAHSRGLCKRVFRDTKSACGSVRLKGFTTQNIVVCMSLKTNGWQLKIGIAPQFFWVVLNICRPYIVNHYILTDSTLCRQICTRSANLNCST